MLLLFIFCFTYQDAHALYLQKTVTQFIYFIISSLFILGYKKIKIDIPYRNEKIKLY